MADRDDLARLVRSLRPRAEIGLASLSGESGDPSLGPGGPSGGRVGKDFRFWHPVSKTKLRAPLEEQTASYRETDPLVPRQPINPEALQGSILIPAIGDRTITGKELTGINDMPFDMAVPLQGGPNFMRGPQQQADNAAWASTKGAVTGLAKKIGRLGAEGQPVNLVYSPMAQHGSDFADMTTKALIEQMKGAKVSRSAKAAFDEEMAAKVKNWPGIDKIGSEWIAGSSGTDRAKLAKVMALGKHQQAKFPDVGATRAAITEPDLLDTPTGHAGYNIATADPGGRIIKDPALPHSTYNTQLGGKYLGSLDTPIPRSLMFPDWAKTRPANEPGPRNDRAFLMQPVAQQADQRWLDQVMKFMEGVRR